ncbi:uncharacterized protein [Rutidosis leptorrhynchoides]|uniref:uncharacterized protein n=1 Tax=Rutidosis leptorrhynchoides TaxID=125765 RepID=UPI003A9A6129
MSASASLKESEKHNTSKSSADDAEEEEEEEEEEEVIIKKHWDLDMFTLKEVGIYKSLEERLRQHYYRSPNGSVYRCYDDWEFLMYSDRKVFEKLCQEFHSSYDIKITPKDVDDDEFMTFKLGGEPRSMSLYEFSRVLGIYSEKEVDDDWDVFRDYIW